MSSYEHTRWEGWAKSDLIDKIAELKEKLSDERQKTDDLERTINSLRESLKKTAKLPY